MKTLFVLATTLLIGPMALAASTPAKTLRCAAQYYDPMLNGYGPQRGSYAMVYEQQLEVRTPFKPKAFEGHQFAWAEGDDKYIKFVGSIDRSDESPDVTGSIFVLDKLSHTILGSIEDIVLSKEVPDFEDALKSKSIQRTSIKITVRLTEKTIKQIEKDTGGQDKYGNEMAPTWVTIYCSQEK